MGIDATRRRDLGWSNTGGFFLDTTAVPPSQGVAMIGGPALRGAVPADPLLRLLWLAGSDGRPHLATLAEQDARWERWRRYLTVEAQGTGGRRTTAQIAVIADAREAAEETV